MRVTENFSARVTSKLFEKQIREVTRSCRIICFTSTSVLPPTLEDLLVLGLCTAGGFVAISTFPARRQAMADQVNRIADGLHVKLKRPCRRISWKLLEIWKTL